MARFFQKLKRDQGTKLIDHLLATCINLSILKLDDYQILCIVELCNNSWTIIMNTFQFFNNTPLKSHPSVVGPLHGLDFVKRMILYCTQFYTLTECKHLQGGSTKIHSSIIRLSSVMTKNSNKKEMVST